MKQIDLTTGKIKTKLWLFALPLMLSNVFQQFYNIVDTWIVGRFVSSNALGAVGSAYSLMTFLTSIIIGLCLGASAYFSMVYGKKDYDKLRNAKFISLLIIGLVSLLISAIAFCQVDLIIYLLQVPDEIVALEKEYLICVFCGILATFIYNFYSNLLRAIGNSFVPLVFLGISVVTNVALDFYFVAVLNLGISGAGWATVISQYISAFGIFAYSYIKYPDLHIKRQNIKINKNVLKNILSLSGFTCLQQSVMNFGILAVSGIVNSFGASVMSAFAVAVKIDTVAYMPVQDFGNAFSTFVAQNYGAGKIDRIKKGIKQSLISVVFFCAVISTAVFIFAPNLMSIFVTDYEIIMIGANYLKIEGTFYIGIGILFMLYGYYRAVNKPVMSVILTVISLGTRVLLSIILPKFESIGYIGIWISIPIGWFLADLFGVIYYLKNKPKI